MTGRAATHRIRFWLAVAIGWGLIAFGVFRYLVKRPVPDAATVAAWVVGGNVVHDAVLVPAMLLVVVATTHFVRRPWRTPVLAGLAASMCVLLVAVPLLGGFGRKESNPSVLPLDYDAAVLGALGIVWILASAWLIGCVVHERHRVARAHERRPVTRLAVVGGHSLLDAEWPNSNRAHRHEVQSRDGVVTVIEIGDCVLLQRHGEDHYIPAHHVDHRRNMHALASLGCDRVLALSSVGALHNDLSVGTIMLPDDFIALDQPPISAFDDRRAHIVPRFDHTWRTQVVDAVRVTGNVEAIDGGVYWQTNGPRFETPAEVRFQAAFADVVGMTIGSECVAACELELTYACICVVDNLANGVGENPLTLAEFDAGIAHNRSDILDLIAAIVPELAQ